MVSKKKISKVKLSYHVSSMMKASNASRLNRQANSSQSMVNAKALPHVHVAITRLMPTKMPDIAKEQYYKLVKSPGLLRVLPAENTTWDELSPEATPERELEKKSLNSDLLSPITRTQLQLSPFDLEDADLGNEPWSDSSDPYPSPKSPENNENDESDVWFERSFEGQEEVDESLCRDPVSPCDNEVEAIMARQNCEVPKDVPCIPAHRHHTSSGLLQTIVIPLQPVVKSPCSLEVSRDDLPVFDRDGIWTSPGRKWSIAKQKEIVKRDLKRKRGIPKKERKAPKLTTSVNSSNSTDNITSPSPLANGIQGLQQMNAEEGVTDSEEAASPKTDTELLNENRSVEKVSSKKRGRHRKRRSTLIRKPEAEQHRKRVEKETSKSRNKKLEVRVSPVILERTVDSHNSTSQEGTQVSVDVRGEKRSENREAYMNLQIEGHPVQGSGTSNEQTPVLSALESLFQGNDLDSTEEVASFDEIPVEDDEQVRETPVTTPSKWLSAVQIESSPLIKSLEISTKQNGAKSPTKTTIFLTDEEEKRQLSFNFESNNNNESIQQERLMRPLRQELFPQKELSTGSKCISRNRKSSEERTLSPRTMSLRPLEARLSTSSNEDVPVLNKVDKSKECLGNCGGSSPLRRLSVVCEGLPDAVVLNKNNTCDSFVLLRSASTENNTPENEMTERQEVPNRSLSFGPGCQADKRSPLPRNRGLSVQILNGKDTNSDQRPNELLEGKVNLIPCSPIQISRSPVFDARRRRKCSSSSTESSRSDTACNRTFSFTKESNTLRKNSDDKELSKKSSGRRRKSSLDNPLSHNLSIPLSSTKSNTSSLDATVPLSPCSPVQAVRISTIWKQPRGKERKTSSSRTSPSLGKSSETVSLPSAFKSPVPLKDLVVKCDRVAAGDYNVLKSPENFVVKPPKRRRTRRKVETENKDTSKEQKRKTGKKRKRGNKSDKDIKPRKKRKLGIPDHYKGYKPCQLPTISHTQMRYRVAFNLWPQKYSGALDRINQRLMNQNAFWKSLG